jgi:hypothetical protein
MGILLQQDVDKIVSLVSPQLAIITCAYAEHKWSIAHLSWSSRLASVRFVDDLGIILAYN